MMVHVLRLYVTIELPGDAAEHRLRPRRVDRLSHELVQQRRTARLLGVEVAPLGDDEVGMRRRALGYREVIDEEAEDRPGHRQLPRRKFRVTERGTERDVDMPQHLVGCHLSPLASRIGAHPLDARAKGLVHGWVVEGWHGLASWVIGGPFSFRPLMCRWALYSSMGRRRLCDQGGTQTATECTEQAEKTGTSRYCKGCWFDPPFPACSAGSVHSVAVSALSRSSRGSRALSQHAVPSRSSAHRRQH